MASIPAIAVTAFAMPEDRKDALEGGFDAHVGMTFLDENLRGVIGQSLNPA